MHRKCRKYIPGTKQRDEDSCSYYTTPDLTKDASHTETDSCSYYTTPDLTKDASHTETDILQVVAFYIIV